MSMKNGALSRGTANSVSVVILLVCTIFEDEYYMNHIFLVYDKETTIGFCEWKLCLKYE